MTFYNSPTGLPPKTYGDSDCECDLSVLELSNLVNPNKNECTVCTREDDCNMFLVPRANPFPKRCILDEMTYDEVVYLLRTNPNAARDLEKITDNPTLLALAREIKLNMTDQRDSEIVAKRINANSLPFYTVIKGKENGF